MAYAKMTDTKKSDTVRMGDTVTVSVTGVVQKMRTDWGQRVADLDNGASVDLKGIDEGKMTLVIEKRRRPKTGEVVHADDMRATMWKSGTLIRGTGDAVTRVLNADGKWITIAGAEYDYYTKGSISFTDLYGKYTLLHVTGA